MQKSRPDIGRPLSVEPGEFFTVEPGEFFSDRAQSPIIIIIVNRPQEVAESHLRYLRPVPSRYFVSGAEVDSLIDSDIHHIISHIRKSLIDFRLVDEGTHH